ncbi:ATP-binding cassette domain-containing protein [Nocardia otitidiscaviarum]|uniref:ATP-binding cassette domain-containing protein n=1 Tax=Nocardia otitidiscaviarum TaxID=1823 RepID=A0A516NNY9_9NOCA|nr:ATP-binding cassette domain-containing protein [Nocardia otitidiscaviarum]MCP9624125.1 ATP-binding cassette domain-containing protein [Nocardia otitidiscaviarum]QDP80630.1 ATP-binding cassette domain-containing protein [Nocardia otitidiscaviarum]
MTVLRLDHVTKTFGRGETAVRAVDRVDLAVAVGELIVVMGPSGSGKSTLLQLMGALLSPSEGEIRIQDRPLSGLGHAELARLRLHELGFVFQSYNLLGALSALENVALPAALAGASHRTRRDRAEALLARLGLAHRSRHRPDALSGGEQQRVAIARALINDPSLLLADEPTANLDAASGYQVLHLLQEIAADERKTIVIVTHDHRITAVADRLLWLAEGQLRDRETAFVTAADPVCGMEIMVERAAGHRTAGGRTLYFCSRICLDKYDADPQRYRSAVPNDEGQGTR